MNPIGGSPFGGFGGLGGGGFGGRGGGGRGGGGFDESVFFFGWSCSVFSGEATVFAFFFAKTFSSGVSLSCFRRRVVRVGVAFSETSTAVVSPFTATSRATFVFADAGDARDVPRVVALVSAPDACALVLDFCTNASGGALTGARGGGGGGVLPPFVVAGGGGGAVPPAPRGGGASRAEPPTASGGPGAARARTEACAVTDDGGGGARR